MKRFALKTGQKLETVYHEYENGFAYFYSINETGVLPEDIKNLEEIIRINDGIENSFPALNNAFNACGAKKEFMEKRCEKAYEKIEEKRRM